MGQEWVDSSGGAGADAMSAVFGRNGKHDVAGQRTTAAGGHDDAGIKDR